MNVHVTGTWKCSAFVKILNTFDEIFNDSRLAKFNWLLMDIFVYEFKV